MNNQVKSYVKYSALAFQMIGIIAFFTFIGYKIDEWQLHKMLYFTAGFSLVGVIISLYTVFKNLKS